MADPDTLATHLEPEAVATLGTSTDTVLTASIAISLKRIADLFERAPDAMELHRLLIAAADPVGFGDFRNATDFGLSARAVLKKMDREQ